MKKQLEKGCIPASRTAAIWRAVLLRLYSGGNGLINCFLMLSAPMVKEHIFFPMITY
jgi:hypothetical protein